MRTRKEAVEIISKATEISLSVGDKVNFVKCGEIWNGVIEKIDDGFCYIDDSTKYGEKIAINKVSLGHANHSIERRLKDFWSCFSAPLLY